MSYNLHRANMTCLIYTKLRKGMWEKRFTE